jgi:acyl dehydratase
MPPRLNWADAQALSANTVLHRLALPPVTATQLAFYCAAVRVADPIHYDRDFARRFGFSDLVVNGSLRIAWLTHALADLVAAPDYVASLRCSHRGPMFAGDALTLEVRVSDAPRHRDAGCELPCVVDGTVSGRLVDRAEGLLYLARRLEKKC